MSKRKKKVRPTRDDVEIVIATYQHLMGLDNWKIVAQYHDISDDEYMTCHPSPGYLRAYINVNMDLMDNMATLQRTVIHELVHIQLSPYTDAAVVFAGDNRKVLDDLEEFVVTQIERWPLWETK